MQPSNSFPAFSSPRRQLATTSASVHSHLSALTSNAQPRRPPRLQVPSFVIPNFPPKKPPPGLPSIWVYPPDVDSRINGGTSGGVSYAVHTGVAKQMPKMFGFALGPCALLAKVAAVAYCCLSMMIFSEWLGGWDVKYSASSLSLATPAVVLLPQRLPPKTTTIHPPPLALNTMVFPLRRGVVKNPAQTSGTEDLIACLWTTGSDLGHLPAWISHWRGSVSLLISTHIEPRSEEYETLVRRLAVLSSIASSNSSFDTSSIPISSIRDVNIHILTTSNGTLITPNVYINLSLLLSRISHPTSTQVLFPGSLDWPSPLGTHALLLAHAKSSTIPALLVDSLLEKDAISNISTSFVAPGLSPLLLPPTTRGEAWSWCPERLIPPVGRAEDWEECVFAMWLKYFGRISRVVAVSREDLSEEDTVTRTRFHSREEKQRSAMNRRLANHQREEACVLAAKQLASAREAQVAGGQVQVEETAMIGRESESTFWLREACSVVLSGWGYGLL